jgi:hypothetical protein
MYKLLLMAFVAVTAVNDRPLQQNITPREPILCVAPKTFGRCTGSDNCTACSNCSACKHCSQQGGSCGVCKGAYAPKSAPKKPAKQTPKPARQTTPPPAKEPATPPMPVKETPQQKPAPVYKAPSEYKDRQTIEVTSQTNIYREPAETSDVVIQVNPGDKLVFISYEGEWLYVYVTGKQRNGWINYKYVK